MALLIVRILLLLLTAFAVRSQYVHENVIYQKLNEVSLTRSEWKVACIYEIQTILQYVKVLAQEINQAQEIISNIERDYRLKVAAAKLSGTDPLSRGSRNQVGFAQAFGQMKNEIFELAAGHKRLQKELQSYNFLSTSSKKRRSLVPVLGRIFSGLFGLATESQVRNLRAGIKALSQNQDTIYHQVEHQMSMINVSRKYISENRQAINELTVGVHQVDKKLDNMTKFLTNDINLVARFVQLYTQLDLALKQIKRMIDDATRYIDHLRLELSFLALGHVSPNLISPEELSKLLFDLKSQIPRNFRLPTHPGRKLWSYFRNLNCAAVIEENKIVIILTVPLLDSDDRYELYEVHNLAFPYPYLNTKSEDTDMMAVYRLESDAIMINTFHTEYILLSRDELYACSHSQGKYCNVHHARLAVSKSKTCVISIFMKNLDNIKRYCTPIINANVQLPQAVHLNDGIYAISTEETLRLRMICQQKSDSELILKPPLSIIKLEMTCSAHNREITYFFSQTKYHTKSEPFFAMLRESNFSEVQIWQPFISSLPNFSKTELPEILKTVDKIPMSEFIDRMQAYRQIKLGSEWQFPFWAKVIIGVALILILIIVYKCRRHIGFFCIGLCGRARRREDKPQEKMEPEDLQLESRTGENSAAQELLRDQKDVESLHSERTVAIKSIYPTLDLTKTLSKSNVTRKSTSSPDN